MGSIFVDAPSTGFGPAANEKLEPEDFHPTTRARGAQTLSRPSLSYWQDAWMRLRKNRQALVSLVIVVLLVIFTLAGPFLWTVDPSAQDLSRISEPPSFAKAGVVLGELDQWEPPVVADFPASPETAPANPAEELAAPAALSWAGDPSTDSVRLRWAPVPGAAGYVVYRAEGRDVSAGSWGVPLGEVEAGNIVGYEDRFNLESKTYTYTVVAKNVDESQQGSSVTLTLPHGIPLAQAQQLDTNLQPGDTLTLRAHPLGTDYLGRDLLARLMAGGRVSLFIGIVAPLISLIFGVALGGISGFAGGRIDGALMRFTDFVLALPFLLFMILFKVAFGAQAGESGIMPMLLAMVLLSWTGAARLTRGQVLQLRESEFVQASRLLGASFTSIVFRHLIPNTMGVVLVSFTFAVPSAIFTEAFLSFIGMGVVPPTPSWGSLCNDGIQTFLTHPHEFLFPAVLISVAVLAFNLLGDGLRDALDPKLRSLS